MTSSDFLWRLLVHAALFSTVALTVGGIAVRFIRQPVDRLRLIQWTLACSLIAPIVPNISAWNRISIPLLTASNPTQSARREFTATASLDPQVAPSESKATVVTSPHDELATAPATVPSKLAAAVDSVNQTAIADSSAPVEVQATSPLASIRIIDGIVFVYAAVVLGTGVWWMLGLWRRTRLERSALPACAELQAALHRMMTSKGRPVRLLVSDQIDGPMTWGTIHPVIILPSRFAKDIDSPQLRWCLAHELSHVERRDYMTLLLAQGAQLLCFYQPVYWWLRRQINLYQDYLADARAARQVGAPEDYAEFLVRIAESRLQAAMPATLGISSRKSQLFHRIRMLLGAEGELSSTCTRSISVGVLLGALALLTFAGTVRLDTQEGVAQQTAESVQEAGQANAQTTATPVDRQTKDGPDLDESKLEAGVVSGVVVRSSDKSPIADAVVILHTGRGNKTRSDAQGRFRFENIQPRAWAFSASAYQGNLVSEQTFVDSLPSKDPTVGKFAPLRLELREGKQASFTVKSAVTGQPIAGTEVRLAYPHYQKATTDQRGVAAVEGLLPQEYHATILAGGHARYASEINLSQSGRLAEFKIELQAGGAAKGVVLDASGQPLPEVNVVYRAGERDVFNGDARTTDNGVFAYRFLPLDTPINVSVQKNDYEVQQKDIVLTAKQREIELRFTMPKLPPGKSIMGTVVDRSGKPVVGASIVNQSNRSDQRRETKTDAQGKFKLDNLYKGWAAYDLYVAAPGFAPHLVQIDPGPASAPGVVVITLDPGHRIRGRVALEGGGSPKGATVSLRNGKYPNSLGKYLAVDADGLFEFDSLPEDVHFDVRLNGYADLHDSPLPLDRADVVTVTLALPGVVRGRVISAETGQPVPQFRVRLGLSEAWRPSDPRGTWNATWSNPGQTFTSDKGEFLIQPLTPGLPIALAVEQEGYQRAAVPHVLAAKMDQATPVEIKLTRLDSSQLFTLSGQFLDHTGKPKTGAQLRLIVSTNQPTGSADNNFNWVLIKGGQLAQKSYCEQFLTGVTNAEGRFQFKDILPGRYLQLAYWGAGVPETKSLAFDESKVGASENITIRLPKPAKVHGSFERSKFPQAGSIQVSRKGESFQNFELKLDDNRSTFAVEDLPPGDYFVTIMSKPQLYIHEGHRMSQLSPLANRELQLAEGDVKEVNFTVSDAVKR